MRTRQTDNAFRLVWKLTLLFLLWFSDRKKNRGDLGVEVSLAVVPVAQKQLIRKANAVQKPVITATQMLESMINAPVPTRAEVSDVSNAIFDGTDAVMTSGETAAGSYPIETVRTMATICATADAEKNLVVPSFGPGGLLAGLEWLGGEARPESINVPTPSGWGYSMAEACVAAADTAKVSERAKAREGGEFLRAFDGELFLFRFNLAFFRAGRRDCCRNEYGSHGKSGVEIATSTSHRRCHGQPFFLSVSFEPKVFSPEYQLIILFSCLVFRRMALYRGVEPFYTHHLSEDDPAIKDGNPLSQVSQDLLASVLNPNDTIVIVCGYFPLLPLLSNSVRIIRAGVGLHVRG